MVKFSCLVTRHWDSYTAPWLLWVKNYQHFSYVLCVALHSDLEWSTQQKTVWGFFDDPCMHKDADPCYKKLQILHDSCICLCPTICIAHVEFQVRVPRQIQFLHGILADADKLSTQVIKANIIKLPHKLHLELHNWGGVCWVHICIIPSIQV